MPKPKKIKYDAINISKIMWRKRQQLFVKAAKTLGLKIVVIGPHRDKSIKLDCPHYFIPDQAQVFKKLNQARFYVDASIFEGFGMTPIEAAFLDKITIASDTYVHKEVLGEYPLYFKRDNVEDLVEKMKMVINGEFTLNKEAVRRIKKKYSVNATKNRLLDFIESII
ncbi:MAG: glycosyltransferase [Promethearchaeota archaeon]